MKTLLPSGVTLAGLFFALFAMFEIADGNVVRGAWLIWVAALLDVVDGAVARALGAISNLGKELDSLVDFASAGIAPAFLAHTVFFADWGWVGMIPPFIWASFAAARLARFNSAQTQDAAFFQGVPSPPAATSVVHYFLFSTATFDNDGNPYIALAIILFSGSLMLSNVRYEKARWLAPTRILRNHYGIGVIVMVLALPFFPRQSVFIITFGSIVQVLVRHVVHREGPIFGTSPTVDLDQPDLGKGNIGLPAT